MRQSEEARRLSGLIAGVLLLVVGGLFILQNLGTLHAGRIADYWPMFLVWIGLSKMLAPARSRRFASGWTILLIGVFFQLDELGLIRWRMRELWPVVLVLVGLGLIAESILGRRRVAETSSAAGQGGHI
jgi:hypothetical protein